MKKCVLKEVLLATSLVLLFGCGTPKELVYMQDVADGTTIPTMAASPIRLQPMDQISVVVTGLDAQVSAMFNLPYYSRQIGITQSMSDGSGNAGTINSNNSVSGYTVDSKGEIDFPVLGKIQVKGKTREETSEHIKQLLIDSRQIKDPVVTVEFMNLGYSVLGEVSKPGRYHIDRDIFTLFDAISLAGDLTIDGRRENVMVVRGSGTDQEQVYTIDLTNSASVYASPAYYIQQGDLVYVTPNKKRLRDSTVMGNSALTPSFWISMVTSLTSVATSVMILLAK
ncbi:MAG: polysaccharide biosynthesis/export family protein [Bacteroidales bacterium]|nr:polysaccharide biosynthesis/export family protein [Bacteroidales bacterium]